VHWRCIIATQSAVESAANSTESESKRLEATRRFAIESARLAAATRCHDVVILDMAGVSPVTDFYIIATGTSPRQMRAVCDQVDELAEKTGFKSYHRSGYEGETWIAVDYVDVVLHIFNPTARSYYDLENLWGEAKRVNWDAAPSPTASA
jgi:ribosome-associated protein